MDLVAESLALVLGVFVVVELARRWRRRRAIRKELRDARRLKAIAVARDTGTLTRSRDVAGPTPRVSDRRAWRPSR